MKHIYGSIMVFKCSYEPFIYYWSSKSTLFCCRQMLCNFDENTIWYIKKNYIYTTINLTLEEYFLSSDLFFVVEYFWMTMVIKYATPTVITPEVRYSVSQRIRTVPSTIPHTIWCFIFIIKDQIFSHKCLPFNWI